MSGRSRRAYHPSIPGEGAEVVLDPEESHHVTRVLRLRAGDDVSVFDGRGGEWSGRLLETSPVGARVAVGAALTDAVEPTPPVILVQGACRADRVEWALQKGTEVGVFAFAIVPFARSEGADRAAAKLDRWRRIVLEACKQSGRRRIPDVAWLDTAPPLETGARGFVLDAGAGVEPIGALLAAPAPSSVSLAVGPEGGLEPDEIAALVALGFRRASLGPRILRTETAGPVAAALVLHAWGDLGRA